MRLARPCGVPLFPLMCVSLSLAIGSPTSRLIPPPPPTGPAAPKAAALELLLGSLLSNVLKLDNFSVGGAPAPPRGFRLRRGRSPAGREDGAPPPRQLSPPPPPPRQLSPRRPSLSRGAAVVGPPPAARLRQLPPLLAMSVLVVALLELLLLWIDKVSLVLCRLYVGVEVSRRNNARLVEEGTTKTFRSIRLFASRWLSCECQSDGRTDIRSTWCDQNIATRHVTDATFLSFHGSSRDFVVVSAGGADKKVLLRLIVIPYHP